MLIWHLISFNDVRKIGFISIQAFVKAFLKTGYDIFFDNGRGEAVGRIRIGSRIILGTTLVVS
jgi:hypothetical protein